MQFITLIAPLLLLLQSGYSFSPSSTLISTRSCSVSRHNCRTVVFASTDEETAAESPAPELSETSKSDVAVTDKVEPAVAGSESAPYPIDLPSPLLLSASMVLAITSTGTWHTLFGILGIMVSLY